jgi:hypothetical protein
LFDYTPLAFLYKAFNFAMFASNKLDNASQSSSNFFLYYFNAFILKLRFLFSSFCL